MTTHPITKQIREAARKLLDGGRFFPPDDRRKLKAIADPQSGRKSIPIDWWRRIHGVSQRQAEMAARGKDRKKWDALKRMADPKRNDNANERAVAARKLAEFKPTVIKRQSAPGWRSSTGVCGSGGGHGPVLRGSVGEDAR
jgi:hypothetical protein